MTTRVKRPKVNLVGQNGNAFNIIGLCQRAAKKAEWTDEQWKKVRDEMMSDDYDHLLVTAMTYFDVDGDEEEDQFCCANCLNAVAEEDDVCGNCGHPLAEDAKEVPEGWDSVDTSTN